MSTPDAITTRWPRSAPFFAMETCFQPDYPRLSMSPAAHAEIAARSGYAGLSWKLGPTEELEELLAATSRLGIRCFALYVGAVLTRNGLAIDPRVDAAMELMRDTGAVIWLHTASEAFAPSDPAGDEIALPVLRELAERASDHGLVAAIYPHYGEWTERVEDGARLAEPVGHPALGVTFNLCHALMKGTAAGLKPILEHAAPWLRMVTVNGANAAGAATFHEVLKPLGEGDFSIAGLLALLHHAGYRGPIGLQGYGLPGETEAKLVNTREAWDRILADFERQSAASE